MASFSSPLVQTNPTTFVYQSGLVGGVLIGDYVNDSGQTPAGSSENIPTPTMVGTVPVSACLELQSTTSALLIMRVTTTQRNAFTEVVNGMMIYNTTTSTFQFYQGGAWLSLTAGAGGGNVIGPLSSTATAIALFTDTTGQLLSNSLVLIDVSGNITGSNTIANAVGTAALPSYTFTGRTNTGVYSSAANSLDFATDGTRQLSVGGAITAVNYAQIQGSVGSSPILINALGTDTNISVQVVPKGTGSLVVPAGAVATPGIAIAADLTTGIYSGGSHAINFATNGQLSFQIANTASTVNYIIASGNSTNAGSAVTQPGFVANGSDTVIDVSVTGKGAASGLAVLPNTVGGAGSIKLWNGAGTFYSQLLSGSVAANIAWTLPLVDAAYANAPLVSNASGVLSFSNTAVLTKTITLTAANVNAAYATPQSLLPAVAGVVYVIQSAYVYTNVSTAFTAGGVAIIQYGNTVHGAGTDAVSGTLTAAQITAAASQVYTLGPVAAATVLTGVTNTGIFFSNATQAFATGTASTVVITLSYLALTATV